MVNGVPRKKQLVQLTTQTITKVIFLEIIVPR